MHSPRAAASRGQTEGRASTRAAVAALVAAIRGSGALAASHGRARAPRAPPHYGSSTTTLKNLNAVSPSSGTSAHGPSSLSAPFNTACISAPVQRFTFGSHSTFDFIYKFNGRDKRAIRRGHLRRRQLLSATRHPISPPVSSGKCGFWKLRGVARGLTRDLRQETWG